MSLTTRLTHDARKILIASTQEAQMAMSHVMCDAGHQMVAMLDRNTLPAVKILWSLGADVGEARAIMRKHFRVMTWQGRPPRPTLTVAYERSVKKAVQTADIRKAANADISDLIVGILLSESPSVNEMIRRWNLPIVRVLRQLKREEAYVLGRR